MNGEYTINELKEKLSRLDELSILELLNITSEELVEFLADEIEEKYEEVNAYFQDEEEDD